MSGSLPDQSLIEGILISFVSFIQQNLASCPYPGGYHILIKATTYLKHARWMLMTSFHNANSLERSDC